jgi:hypothetical protein
MQKEESVFSRKKFLLGIEVFKYRKKNDNQMYGKLLRYPPKKNGTGLTPSRQGSGQVKGEPLRLTTSPGAVPPLGGQEAAPEQSVAEICHTPTPCHCFCYSEH